MKVSKLTYLLVIALALTFASTGCRKRPTNVTNIRGTSGKVGDPLPKGAGGDIAGATVTPEPPIFGNPPPGGGSQTDKWNNATEDRASLAAHTIRFDFDSSVVKSSEKSNVEAAAAYLKANPEVGLRIEGHTDERGTEEYNRSLGERRALAIRELVVGSGVGADRVVTVSFGEDKPEDPGHNEAAWAKNRRGVFVVLILK
jgi:peptidoglycan-associated lipoprotein